MPTQRSLATQFWNSPGIITLSKNATLLAAYVKTAPHSNFIGLYVFDWDQCGRETKMKRSEIRNALSECSEPQKHDGSPYLMFDQSTGILWVVKALEYEFPTTNMTDRQREGIRILIERLPRSWIVLEYCKHYAYMGDPFPMLIDRVQPVIECPHSDGDKEGDKEPDKDGSRKPERTVSSSLRLSTYHLPLTVSSDPSTLPRAKSSKAKELLDTWSDLYLEKFGQRPEVEGKRDMECAKAILGGRTLEQAAEIVRYHFDHPGEFYREKSLYGIHHIRKDCNQIIARLQADDRMQFSDLPKSTQRNLKAGAAFVAMGDKKPW